uniref:N-acetylgalactosaminide beta-1,3-galactosyltransferase n=1 Tax=Parastrongyloides trichosuri TaxID=131310 RepID=A0A0N4ZAG3_PARTI
MPEYNFEMFNASYDNTVFEGIIELLNRDVKIFCIILTSPNNKTERSLHQKATWIKRCDNYIYASSKTDLELPALKYCDGDSYQYSMCKFKNALKQVWKKFGDKYDWYLKVEDDTYVIMENLKAFLLHKDPNTKSYYGYRKKYGKLEFFSGTAGYVISKAATKILVEKGLDNPRYCNQKTRGFDNVEVDACFKKLGIEGSVAMDEEKRCLFNHNNPLYLIFPPNDPSSNNSFHYENKLHSPNLISEYPISFSNISKEMMYVLEYFFYHADVVGKQSKLDLMEELEIKDDDDMERKVEMRYQLIKAFSKFNFLS